MLKVFIKDNGSIYTFNNYTHWDIVGEWVEVYRDERIIGLIRKMKVEAIIANENGVEVIEKN